MSKKAIYKTMIIGVSLAILSACTAKTQSVYKPELPTGEEKSSIYIQRIDELPQDFIMGMDVSSMLVEEESGVK